MTEKNQIDVIRRDIEKMSPQFKSALPSHLNVEKFQRVLVTAVSQNNDLLAADRRSLYAASMRSAQDGLLPDGYEGVITTYRNKNGEKIAKWMPMVAGIMKKVRNSGEISTWSVHEVKENDQFDFQLGDNERIEHRPALNQRGKTIGAYSIVVMKDGGKSREWMGVDEINDIRNRSQSPTKGPWVTDYDEMAKKTVIRRHSKRLPMSTDLDQLIQQDDDGGEAFNIKASVTPIHQAQKEKEPEVEPIRNSRLQKVVDAEVVEINDNPMPEVIDGDGKSTETEYPI